KERRVGSRTLMVPFTLLGRRPPSPAKETETFHGPRPCGRTVRLTVPLSPVRAVAPTGSTSTSAPGTGRPRPSRSVALTAAASPARTSAGVTSARVVERLSRVVWDALWLPRTPRAVVLSVRWCAAPWRPPSKGETLYAHAKSVALRV